MKEKKKKKKHIKNGQRAPKYTDQQTHAVRKMYH